MYLGSCDIADDKVTLTQFENLNFFCTDSLSKYIIFHVMYFVKQNGLHVKLSFTLSCIEAYSNLTFCLETISYIAVKCNHKMETEIKLDLKF